MKKLSRYKYWLPLTVSVTFVGGMWFGAYLSNLDHQSNGEKKLRELFTSIEEYYVDEVDMDSLVELSIPAIISNLDPHSSYIPVKDREEVNSELEGSFGGIGIQFIVNNDTINVVEVIAGGPSEKAGIMPGDRIIAADGKPFDKATLNDDEKVRQTLRGPKGSKIELTILRQSTTKPMKFVLTRGDIPTNTVVSSYLLTDNIGYIKVSKFGRNTYNEFYQALGSLQADGATDYVIDLRGNTGGFMETAILMVNEFLPSGQVIVATRGRNIGDNQITLSDGNGAFKNAKIVVLLDEMSASASEIFSGAMQDNDRGLIIGRRSFGKGLVQRQMDMSDGSELRLTVQRYYTPSGRCIQKDYTPGDNQDYEYEIFERYKNGETLNEDSVKLRKDLMFTTSNGRKVYGGGGIMPDIFVPNDTSGITNYYINVANAGLLMKFAYEYCDLNRANLKNVKTVDKLLSILPSNEVLLSSFVYYATTKGIPARWYYINMSRQLITSQIKAMIAQDVVGVSAYYEVLNATDIAVKRAVKELQSGSANFPIRNNSNKKDKTAKTAKKK
jgi:carboxyl-terminal processing protease